MIRCWGLSCTGKAKNSCRRRVAGRNSGVNLATLFYAKPVELLLMAMCSGMTGLQVKQQLNQVPLCALTSRYALSGSADVSPPNAMRLLGRIRKSTRSLAKGMACAAIAPVLPTTLKVPFTAGLLPARYDAETSELPGIKRVRSGNTGILLQTCSDRLAEHSLHQRSCRR